MRANLRSWLTIRGLARLVWVVLLIAAADIALDRSFRMDVPQRGIMLVLMVAGIAFSFYRMLLRPVSRPITDDALVLEVEKRNPGLGQSVITGLQLLRDAQANRVSNSPELVSAAIHQGIEQSRSVDFSSVLNRRAGQKNWLRLIAGVLAFVFLVVGIFGTVFLQTWFRRNLMLSADLWPRATQLLIVGAEEGEIIVPRGIDHRQLVQILETSRIQNVVVDLEIDAGVTRNIQRMKPTGKLDGREHAFVFNSIASDCRIRAIGGDDTTGWVALKLVEPPAVSELRLDALLPKWTGRETESFSGNGPHSILSGSGLRVGITANKTLQSAELVRGEQITPLNMVDAENRLFQVEIGREGETESVSGGTWAIRLVDERGLGNVRDSSFEVRIRDNEKPSVRSRLLGISGLVVPTAYVPIEWGATDDYGIATVVFDTKWQDESVAIGERKIPVAGFVGGPILAEIPENVTVMELEPLGLQPGMTLRFRQAATDYAQPTSATGESREFLLKIVTEEELLSDLLRREIEQRGVFQQAYDRQLELNSQLLQAVASPGSDENTARELETRLLGLYRAQRTIGTSIVAVASRFDEFLVEVANNRLDEHTKADNPGQTIQGRFENEIIRPIRDLDDKLVNDSARGMETARRSIAQPAELAKAVRETSATQEQILDAMRIILSAMQSSENFQEAVNRLLEIRRIEQNMQRELERKGENPEDIFNPLGDGK